MTRPICPVKSKSGGGDLGAYTVLKVNNTLSSCQTTRRHTWYDILLPYFCMGVYMLVVIYTPLY